MEFSTLRKETKTQRGDKQDPIETSARWTRWRVPGQKAIADALHSVFFQRDERCVDVFSFCGEEQESEMAPFHFWQKNDPKSKFSFFVFVVCGEPKNFSVHKTTALQKPLPLFFCGSQLAPQTHTPSPGRSMRTAKGGHLIL